MADPTYQPDDQVAEYHYVPCSIEQPGSTAVRPARLLEWARWYEAREGEFTAGGGRVARDTDEVRGVCVSTVFLGLDHNLGRDVPLLFETMVFGGEHDQYQERYSTYLAALAGHARALDMVTA